MAEPPACLLGGWAVHLHVTDGFRAAHGRPYIGSRDIDLGVHVDPDSFRGAISDGLYRQTASLIGVETTVVRQSIEQLLV